MLIFIVIEQTKKRSDLFVLKNDHKKICVQVFEEQSSEEIKQILVFDRQAIMQGHFFFVFFFCAFLFVDCFKGKLFHFEISSSL